MEVTGLLKKKGELETFKKKDGGDMTKMGFLLQVPGKFPKDVWVETFNAGVIQFVSETSLETELTCKIDISSREYNGRYFTSVSCFNATADKTQNFSNKQTFNAPPATNSALSDGDDSGLPF